MKKEYTIGEIGKLYQFGADSLRYYERKGILHPKRKENGYRVYTLDDVWRLNVIKDLRKLGFSTDQIKGYLENRSVETTKRLIEKEIDIIEREIEPLVKLKDTLTQKLATLEDATKNQYTGQVVITHLKQRNILFIEAPMNRDEEVDLAFRQLEGTNDVELSLFANKDMGVFLHKDAFEKGVYTQYDKAFFFVEDDAKVYHAQIDAGSYAALVYRGSYKQSQYMFEKVMDFIKQGGYTVVGQAMEIYRLDIHGTAIVDEYITEIQIPVSK